MPLTRAGRLGHRPGGLCAESLLGADHLLRIQEEARRTVGGGTGRRPAVTGGELAERALAFPLGLLLLLAGPVQARETIPLDAGWKFHLGDVPDAFQPGFDDSAWRPVDLPHDWSIEAAPSREQPSAGGGGFFPTGVGWYRRTFRAPLAWSGKRVRVEFDGVYRNAEVWIDGQRLGLHHYGYTPFRYDLTRHLQVDGDNTLAVRVDNSAQPNSRWYSGSGLYRRVRLLVVEPVHLDPEGLFVATTEASVDVATLRIGLTVRNDLATREAVAVDVGVTDSAGRELASARVEGRAPARGSYEASLDVHLAKPQLWSPETPALHRLVTRVSVEGRITDALETRFGIRTIAVSPERGFELNGRSLLLFGGNVHHDNGPLGAAAFDRADERRVEILKAAGFNAIRTAHNPPSPALLDACDRLGLLVIDEAFDGWGKPKLAHDYSEHFADGWRRDLEAMVLRDRNHPSVVMWSLGNEVYERGTAEGARLAAAMATRVRELDATRPVTAGINGMGESGVWTQVDPLFAALEVSGYNYERARYRDDHERLPSRVMYGAESFPADAYASWAAAARNSWVIGDFVWSALDYLGEAGIGRVFPPGEPAVPHWVGVHYPWYGAACGDVDVTGWRRPVSHYRNVVWNRGETLYLAVREPTPEGEPWTLSQWAVPPAWPSWTWPGWEGRPLRVDVYTRHDSVRLYLDGERIGEAPAGDAHQFVASFTVPYAPGRLRAAGLRDGREVESRELSTAGEATRIRLSPDRVRIRADGQDLSFVTVEIVDGEGRLRPDASVPVRYALEGVGSIAAIGAGDLTSREPYRANPRRVFRGRALVVVRSTTEPGPIALRAEAPGLEGASVRLRSSR